MQYYKLCRKYKTSKGEIKEIDTKLVLATFQHTTRCLESEKLRQTKPLNIFPNNVNNNNSKCANIDVYFEDIFLSKYSQPILLDVPPMPTLSIPPAVAVANRRHLEKSAQPMIPYTNPIPRPPPIPNPTWTSSHPITNPPWPPMPHHASFQYPHRPPMPPHTYNSPREIILPYSQSDISFSRRDKGKNHQKNK